MPLTLDQRRRYARHLVLPEIGESGQEKLLASHITIIGAGGLGSHAAGALAAMGVGHLRLVDADRVELSNLQRQTMFETADIGTLKVQALKNRMHELNPDVRVEALPERLTAENAQHLVAGAQVVVDATDNFETRIALHAACKAAETPLIYAAISGLDAQITTWKGYIKNTPCLQDFMPEIPLREVACSQEGIVGALAGMMGNMQALEAVKELLSLGSLSGRIWRYNALSGWNQTML